MYIYAADVWCDSCGRAICRELEDTGKAPADPGDPYSYDSDYYPKWVEECESDTPDHCASGSECLEAEDLSSYLHRRVGALIEDKPSLRYVGALLGSLTSHGEDYVREALAEPLPRSSCNWLPGGARVWRARAIALRRLWRTLL